MIRPLILLVLLGASALVFGEPLYKWVEPDGAITFSVKKPPAGVKFETVNPADSAKTTVTSESISSNDATTQRQLTTIGANPALQAALPPSTQTSQPAQRIAPAIGSQTGVNEISRSDDAGRATVTTIDQTGQINDQTAALYARTRKQRQCEDLQKRVVSLERRLKTRLTPEDMDNTVIHMARYQRSFDQHCSQ